MGALDLGELLVGADHVGGFELLGGDGRAEDVDAVEGGLGRDLGLAALEAQRRIADLDPEVLAPGMTTCCLWLGCG